jgi:uncharacterized protein YkwD
VISIGRRGGALLLGIATGGLLVGGVAVAAPASVVPPSLQTILGSEEPNPPPSPNPPTTSRPAWRTAAPVAAALPSAAAVPADPALAFLNPAPGDLPPPATEAVPVSAILGAEHDPSSDDKQDDTTSGSADASAASGEAAAYAADVIERTNQERRDAGCGDLVPDSRLRQSAQNHASDMAKNDYFAHESEDGTRFDTRIKSEGYSRPAGENIAKGQTSAKQVVREWMASTPHRHNIENCAFTTIGVGYDDDYWVQDFGR